MKNIIKILIGNKEKRATDTIKQHETRYTTSVGKQIISSTETVVFSAKAKQLTEEVRTEVAEINLKAKKDPEVLLKYLNEKNVPIYRLKNASKLLKKINEHTGFICALEGTKAIYINTILKLGLNKQTEPLFILDEDVKIDYYGLLREFYLWYSSAKGLDGFSYEAQELFKMFLASNNPNMSKLNFEQMCLLRSAIARDSEANDFVMNIISNIDGGENIIQTGSGEI